MAGCGVGIGIGNRGGGEWRRCWRRKRRGWICGGGGAGPDWCYGACSAMGEGGEQLLLTRGPSAIRTHGRRSETCASWWACISVVKVLEVIVGILSSAASKYGCQPPSCTIIGCDDGRVEHDAVREHVQDRATGMCEASGDHRAPIQELNLSIEKTVPCAICQAGTQAECLARSPSSSASAPAAVRTAALPPGERLESTAARRTRAPHRHCSGAKATTRRGRGT